MEGYKKNKITYLEEMDGEMGEICWELKKDEHNDFGERRRKSVCRNKRRFERQSVESIALLFVTRTTCLTLHNTVIKYTYHTHFTCLFLCFQKKCNFFQRQIIFVFV